jgi:5-methylcytosine-specific restriction endonuclease McrA
MKKKREQYKDLLLSEKWLAKRLQVFKRDGYRCKSCGTNQHLNCHHTYYITGKKPWEYCLSSLTTLCQTCHTRLHSETKVPVKNSAKPERRTLSKNKTRVKKLFDSLVGKDRRIQERYNALEKK